MTADVVHNKPMSTGFSGFCPERSQLLDDYQEAAKAYSDAVAKLAEFAGSVLHSDLDVLRRACRSAWEKTEKARLALHRHEADHCCDRMLHRQSGAASAG